jgi:hypothetical protein
MYVSREGEQIKYGLQPNDSQQLRDIIGELVPDWALLFARKNADYGSHDDSAGVLGIPGQYADIWRKMSKLKRAMWDGEELEFEKTEEVISDLIGHLFLTLHMMRVKESAERLSVYNSDDAAVDAFIKMVGGEKKAYDMSFSLNPPFGQMVRDKIGPLLEDQSDQDPEYWQQEQAARRLKRGTDERIASGLVHAAIEQHESAPRDGYPDAEHWRDALGRLSGATFTISGPVAEAACSDLMGEEFAEADAAQHGVGVSGDRSVAPLKAAPRRVVTETADGRTVYYDQPHPGGDREELALVPKRLVEQLLGEHHENMGRQMDELGKWALGE